MPDKTTNKLFPAFRSFTFLLIMLGIIACSQTDRPEIPVIKTKIEPGFPCTSIEKFDFHNSEIDGMKLVDGKGCSVDGFGGYDPERDTCDWENYLFEEVTLSPQKNLTLRMVRINSNHLTGSGAWDKNYIFSCTNGKVEEIFKNRYLYGAKVTHSAPNEIKISSGHWTDNDPMCCPSQTKYENFRWDSQKGTYVLTGTTYEDKKSENEKFNEIYDPVETLNKDNIRKQKNGNCTPETVIENRPGEFYFGGIFENPGYSVWFPFVPRSLVVDSHFNVYIGDSVNYRVLKFSPKGEVLNAFKLRPPTRPEKPPVSHQIFDMTLDEKENIYVINHWEQRVEIYSKGGVFLTHISYKGLLKHTVPFIEGKSIAFDCAVSNIEIDKKGRMYLFDDLKMCGGVFSSTDQLLSSDFQAVKNGEGDLKFDESKMVNPQRYHYEFFTKNDKTDIIVKDKDGDLIRQCKGVQIAIDESGEIYETDEKGNIYTFDYYDTLNVLKYPLFD